MSWLIADVVLIVVGFHLNREIYFYEGARLGPHKEPNKIQTLLVV
jgi:hypothetical protein